jgi:hypothetical protein
VNLTGKWIRKPVKKLLITGMILFVVLGCGGGTNVLYPLHARPYVPLAVYQPTRAFLICGDDYYCIAPEHLEELKKFIILQNALIDKYEKNIELHNSAVD